MDMLEDVARQATDAGDLLAEIQRLQTRVAQLEQAQAALPAAQGDGEGKFRAIFQGSPLGIAVVDLQGRLLDSNPALQQMLGYSAAELRGRSFAALTFADDTTTNLKLFAELRAGKRDRYDLEKRYLRKDGSLLWGHLVVSLVVGVNDEPMLLGMVEDITERKRAEETIKQIAYYDPLTNLPNRLLFHDRLRQSLARARRDNHSVALLFLDLDRFKVINDSLGHYIGDLLLKAVADRLSACVREGDTVARMGGDEFTVILPAVAGADDATDVAVRILNVLATAFSLERHELYVTTSIGISMYPADGQDMDTLLKQADAAMYRAKERSRNTYQFYTPAMDAQAYKQLELEHDLRRALERGEFVLHYQPRLETNTGRIVGVEALLRWQHPDLGLVAPGEFIPVAEDTGMIVPIGEWVLRTACRQAKAWLEAGWPALRMSVNLSARQFQQPDIVDLVARVLTETNLQASYLELEITESTTMVHAERTMAVLRALKSMGVHLSMDDFGTGYSSLSYLKQFPIDTLKIDKSFVRDLSANANDAAIAEAVIALAHSLNLSVTAEGVETDAQLAFLTAHRCDEVQGYLLGRPVPSDALAQLLRRTDAPAS